MVYLFILSLSMFYLFFLFYVFDKCLYGINFNHRYLTDNNLKILKFRAYTFYDLKYLNSKRKELIMKTRYKLFRN